MSLDGVAGPAWTDPSPPGPAEGRRLRIAVSTESAEAEVLLDAVHLRASAVPEAGAGREAAPAPAPVPAPAPDDPAAAPSVETAKTRNVLLVNHGDPSLVLAGIAGDLQRQYDWLREWVGAAPERVAVHVAPGYPCGFARPGDPSPEMFLREGPIFDTSNDYAHEMLHCFLFRYGDLPHWFGESMADMAWADAEIGLWKRRKEEFVRTFSRPDHRSHELGVLRAKYGREFFPRVCRLLEKGRARGLAVFRPGVPPAERNGLLLSILSEAAGEDLRPLFTGTLGFDPDTRERQRGY
jgi:hypothetical protein